MAATDGTDEFYETDTPDTKKLEATLVMALKGADSLDDYRKIYDEAPEKSAVKRSALKKIDALFLPKLETAATFTLAALERIYDSVPDGSEVRLLVMNKITAILTPRLEAASTWNECWEVFRSAPYGSEIHDRTVRKLLELAITVQDCLTVHRLASSDTSDIKQSALEKALQCAETAQEFRDVYQACRYESNKSALGERALREMLNLASTAEQCREVFGLAPSDIRELRELAGRTELKFVKTTAECLAVKRLFGRVDQHDEIRLQALERAFDLAGTGEEFLEAIVGCGDYVLGYSNPFRDLVLRKLNERLK